MHITENIWKMDLGASVAGPEGVFFKVWAPHQDRVSVEIVSGGRGEIPLEKNGQGYFKGHAAGVKPGHRYLYILDHGRYPDPGSRSQPDGVHGPSEVIDPGEFCWDDGEWAGVPGQDFIIYEMHVGTFTQEGTFKSIIPLLDYFVDLGVTAVELMPVSQFPGSRNWGYDGVYPYAPQNTYGGPAGFKELINASHKKSLAVILDVVYNHLGPEGNYLGRYGPYFTDKYKTPWGDAINFDGRYSDEVRRYFIDNALYWISEYHIDALRLDAVHGIYDFSARHFLEELSDAVHSYSERLGRDVSVIAESDLNDARIIKPGNIGGYNVDMQWNDDFHHALHALMTGESTGYYEDFGKIEQLEKAFREGYVYSGQYSRFRKRRHGNRPTGGRADQFIVYSQSHDQVGNRMNGDRLSMGRSLEALKLIAGVVILSPFVPLLFMGEEYGETAPFLYFVSHSDPDLVKAVAEGRRKEFSSFIWKGGPRDPQDEKTFWDSKLDFTLSTLGTHKVLNGFYRKLIRIRKESPAFCRAGINEIETRCFEEEKALFVRKWYGSDEVFSLYNFGETAFHFDLTLAGGPWEGILESSSVRWGGNKSIAMERIVSTGSATVSLSPYSFAVYRMER